MSCRHELVDPFDAFGKPVRTWPRTPLRRPARAHAEGTSGGGLRIPPSTLTVATKPAPSSPDAKRHHLPGTETYSAVGLDSNVA